MEVMVKAFNEWMRRFIEEPDKYSREFQNVQEFLCDESEGIEPTYGQSCAAYLTKLMNEIKED